MTGARTVFTVVIAAGMVGVCRFTPPSLGGEYLTGRVEPRRSRGILVQTWAHVSVEVFTWPEAPIEPQPVYMESDEADLAYGSMDCEPHPANNHCYATFLVMPRQAGPVTVRTFIAPKGLPRIALAEAHLEAVATLAETVVLDVERLAGVIPVAIASGHVNHDSYADLVVATQQSGTNQPQLRAWLADWGAFRAVAPCTLTQTPVAIAAGDLGEGGGRRVALALPLALAGESPSQAKLFALQDDGTLAPYPPLDPQQMDLLAEPTSLAVVSPPPT